LRENAALGQKMSVLKRVLGGAPVVPPLDVFQD